MGRRSASVPAPIAVLLLAGVAGGLAGFLLGVPAGAMIGAVLGTGAVSLTRAPGALPTGMRVAGRILIGTTVGLSVEPASLTAIRGLLLPALGVLTGLVLAGIASAHLLARHTELDLVTALLATAPAGMTEMAVAAEDLGLASVVVVAVHLLRILTVIALIPVLVWTTG